MATTPEVAVGRRAPEPPRVARTERRRRPSGEPPPLPRQLHASGKYWLAATVSVLALAILAGVSSVEVGDRFSSADRRILTWIGDLHTPALTTISRFVGGLATPIPIQIAWVITVAVLVITRRWRHILVAIVALWLTNTLVNNIAGSVRRPRPLGFPILAWWHGFSMPSLPIAILATMLIVGLYTLLPQGRLRQIGKAVATAIVVVVAFTRLYLAQDYPTDVIVGVVIGVTIPLLAFRLFVPYEIFPITYSRRRTAHLLITGRRYEAICHALQDQLGLYPMEIEPFGLAGSGGSTPLRVKVRGDPDSYLFCKLYAANHLRSDRWYKLGRTLLYGGLEDEKAFNSVRRLVQYEDYALRLLHAAGLPVPTPGGIVEITPEREYLLVMQFFDGAREIGDVEANDAIIDEGLQMVRRLWDAGLAHRDIKPANLLVKDGRLLLIDTAFAEVRPSPWREAVDLANMMLVLALSSDVPRVYRRAQHYFSTEEIAEAFAATRGLTMPSQLRRMMRERGRDLHADFLGLLPYAVRPIAIQRWSSRRVVLLVATLFAAVLGAIAAAQILTSPLS